MNSHQLLPEDALFLRFCCITHSRTPLFLTLVIRIGLALLVFLLCILQNKLSLKLPVIG